jgi:hypothetical protein
MLRQATTKREAIIRSSIIILSIIGLMVCIAMLFPQVQHVMVDFVGQIMHKEFRDTRKWMSMLFYFARIGIVLIVFVDSCIFVNCTCMRNGSLTSVLYFYSSQFWNGNWTIQNCYFGGNDSPPFGGSLRWMVSNCAFDNNPNTSGFQNQFWTENSINVPNSLRFCLWESRSCIAAIVCLTPTFTGFLPEYPTESSTTSNNGIEMNSSSVGAIIGSVIGAVILIGLVIAVIILVKRRSGREFHDMLDMNHSISQSESHENVIGDISITDDQSTVTDFLTIESVGMIDNKNGRTVNMSLFLV